MENHDMKSDTEMDKKTGTCLSYADFILFYKSMATRYYRSVRLSWTI